MLGRIIVLAAVITAQPLVDEDVLEPSVQNEVDHAIDMAPTNAVAVTAAAFDFHMLYSTNAMSATSRVIALVSSQECDGRWHFMSNDVTPVAVHHLKLAAGYPDPDFAVPTNTPFFGKISVPKE